MITVERVNGIPQAFLGLAVGQERKWIINLFRPAILLKRCQDTLLVAGPLPIAFYELVAKAKFTPGRIPSRLHSCVLHLSIRASALAM